jgi:hypothetical protein
VTPVLHVTGGDVDGTDVTGLTVGAGADTPKVMSDGNWRLGIDAGAPDEQAEKLGALCSVDRSESQCRRSVRSCPRTSAVERAPTEVRREGLPHRVTIGGAVDFEIEDVVSFLVLSRRAAPAGGRGTPPAPG